MIAMLLRKPILAIAALFAIFDEVRELSRAAVRRYPFIEG